MKKVIQLLFIALLSLSLAACGNNVSDEGKTPISITPGNASGDSSVNNNTKRSVYSGKKILIAYFSRVGNTDFDKNVDATTSASLNLKDSKLVGNTEAIADMIKETVSGDLFLIEASKKYPADYNTLVNYAQQEQKEKALPKLITHAENMKDYDIVFIGFPNWWYDMPMAVYSFLEEYDFSGKTVIPFCTHGGSGFSSSEKTIKSMLTGAEVLDGLSVSGNRASGAQRDVEKWLNELKISN